ncbi:hypothetical protein FQN57_000981 [Myotisia sp. PD_48]|nr:hypothetical protein FQN57_000981 [Myotisia sp. PD_48]
MACDGAYLNRAISRRDANQPNSAKTKGSTRSNPNSLSHTINSCESKETATASFIQQGKHAYHPSSRRPPFTMPTEVSDIKQFIEICRRKDASSARIKRNRKTQQIKFKVRCQRFLYTLVLKDSDKADKLKQSLPPALKIADVSKGAKKKSI